jgi:hypothetical protein
MQKTLRAGLVLCLLSIGASGAFAETFSGVISDAMCGAKHTALNDADRACIAKCIDGGSEAVLVSGDKVYKVTVQAAVKTFQGKKVTIQGTAKGDTIDMQSIMKQ